MKEDCSIFKSYTGSALLNNAIMIVLCLSKKKDIKDLTPDLLINLLKTHDLTTHNKRFKSYTMLFTRNGPLFNDELGDMLYKGLLLKLVNNIEVDGHKQCVISGLKFDKSFEELFKEMLIETRYAEAKFNMLEEKIKEKAGYKEKTKEQKQKELLKIIEEKDLSINRMWFPLIGGLGSDAQALPQAKFNYEIHPICILLLQFMTYGAVLYKGGVLLVDSCNYDFSFDYIGKNVKSVKKEFDNTEREKSIENLKPDKSHYILQALEIIAEKSLFYEEYTDLNLWSFSNSGTGASCSVERLPNQTLKELSRFYENGKTLSDFKQLLQSKYGSQFIERLSDKKDYDNLYPAKSWQGVGVPFYDLYQTLIGNEDKLSHAKYIASLINRSTLLPKEFQKLIIKTDAHKDKNYKALVNKVLVEASEHNQWNVCNQLAILDNPESLPVNGNIFKIYKMTHFYLQKGVTDTKQPILELTNSVASNVLGFFINSFKDDIKSQKAFIKEDDSRIAILKRILIENSQQIDPKLILGLLYNNGEQEKSVYDLNAWGISELLRIYYANSQSHIPVNFDLNSLPVGSFDIDGITAFCEKYFTYYCNKYKGEDEKMPLEKFKKHVLGTVPKMQKDYYKWFEQRKEKMKENGVDVDDCNFIYYQNDKYDISLFTTELYLVNLYSKNKLV